MYPEREKDAEGEARTPMIDVHCHMLTPAVAGVTAPHCVLAGIDTSVEEADADSAVARSRQAFLDPALHVEMLDRLGLDAEVISSAGIVQYTSWAEVAVERDLHRANNEEIARWVGEHPGRLIGACTLPLQDERGAMAELVRCVDENGFGVVELPASVNGVYLSDPTYRYVWEAAEAKNLTIFVHPDGVLDPWFRNYSMWNSVGQAIEEAKFLASLIYEGVLEQFTQLKIVMAHGGGYLPHYFGRLDRNVVAWPQSTKNISKRPSEYLRAVYYDTCLYEPVMLQALVDRVGADRIVMGSDFPVGELDPVGFVQRCPSISATEAAAITGGTIAGLLGYEKVASGLGVVPVSAPVRPTAA